MRPRRVGAVYDRTFLEQRQCTLIERTYTLSSAVFVVGFVFLFAVTMASASAEVDSPLADAAMRGDAESVRALLDRQVDVNAPQGDGTTALHWAAYRDDLELAALLIKAGADVDATTRVGNLIPIVMAAKNGNAAMIALLLEAGTDPIYADANGTTTLMYAAAAGKPEAVQVLLDSGADANAKDRTNEQTALMFASSLGRAEVIRVLAAGGADLDAVTRVTVVIKSSDRYRADDGRILVKEDHDEIPMGGMTALHFAARQGHMDAVRELVEAGADMDQVSVADRTSVLTSAIANGHLDIGSFLLEAGANPNLPNVDGQAALYATIDAQWAERTWYPAPTIDQEATNYLDLVSALLKAGADPNQRLINKPWYRTEHGDWARPAGATPFWLAAKANDVPAMKLLIAAGANPTIPSKRGATPLLVAAGFGFEPQVTAFAPGQRLAAVRYLVEEVGANVTRGDFQDYTPLHGAALTIEHDVVLYLMAMGADIKARASSVFGGAGRNDLDVEEKTGDTVADMANGPKAHNMQHPKTVGFLEALGSENSDNCRASTCVVRTQGGP